MRPYFTGLDEEATKGLLELGAFEKDNVDLIEESAEKQALALCNIHQWKKNIKSTAPLRWATEATKTKRPSKQELEVRCNDNSGGVGRGPTIDKKNFQHRFL